MRSAKQHFRLARMYKKSISVGNLQFGMYIVELDRPWTDTPFMFQGFYLRTEQQLQALRKFCKHVFVDAARSGAAAIGRPAGQPPPSAAPGFRTSGTANYPDQTRVEREIKVSSGLYAQTVKALHELVRPLETGSAVLDGKEVQDSVGRLADSVVRNPDALLLMSKMRESKVAAHARALQVSIYMMVFARFLQLERDQIHLLGLLGLLQDIGKARLPGALLEKQGSLKREESEMLKKHVELSAHILGVTSGLPAKFAALALLHHERQDGSGYPRGLKGYQIGLYGSIAAICDTYDALLAPPPHGEGRSPSAAVNILLKERGTAFHGPLVEQFIRCVGSFPVGSLVELDSGEVAIVIAENLVQRLKPKVMLMLDRAGEPLLSRKIVDLAKNPQMGRDEPYRIRRTLEQSRFEFDPRRLFL
jgi:HD-GYP domain-containing protein (c-di-GMP phosphodiesterase class II)